VVSMDHPLASEPQPISRDVVAREVQLVLTDRSPLTAKLRGSIFSDRVWRFADMATRLEYLLGGFGWCHMPAHLIEDLIAEGRLKLLRLTQGEGFLLPLHVVRQPGHQVGRASQWLVEDLRKRLVGVRPCNGAPTMPGKTLQPTMELTASQP